MVQTCAHSTNSMLYCLVAMANVCCSDSCHDAEPFVIVTKTNPKQSMPSST